MSTATLGASVSPRPAPTARQWVIAGSVLILLAFAVNARFGDRSDVAATTYAVRLLVEAAACLWARRRAELPASLRLALLVLGATSLLSAVASCLYVLGSGWPVLRPFLDTGYEAYVLFSYLLAVVGAGLLPRGRVRRDEWLPFVLDLTISVGGYAAVVWCLRLQPVLLASGGGDMGARRNLVMGLASVLSLVILNLLTLCGRAIPSRRAFWLLLAGLGSYLPTTFLGILSDDQPGLLVAFSASYFLGVLPTLWAALAIRGDTMQSDTAENHPDWFRSFNPFSLMMPVALGLSLLHAIRTGHAAAVFPLAIAAALVSLLLVSRLVITIHQNDRRIREQVRREYQAESDRLEALRRVAGGVAHAFSNSLTVVLGQADLGLGQESAGRSRTAFEQIRDAGQRSARLTRHLLWFTGRQHQNRGWLRTSEWLRGLEPELRTLLAPGTSWSLDTSGSNALLHADPAQLRDVVLELVRNAAESMPAGGRLEITLAERNLDAEPDPDAPDDLPPGRYQCVIVKDTGGGMTPETVAHVFEPFFTARTKDPAAGLGLSVAHGVVRAHGGRIELDSTPGHGTTCRVLLPAARG